MILTPTEHEIRPRTQVYSGRALSGKLYTVSYPLRDRVTLTFEALTNLKAQEQADMFYALSYSGAFVLEFLRPCTNGFKATVTVDQDTIELNVSSKFTRDLVVSFLVESYEDF